MRLHDRIMNIPVDKEVIEVLDERATKAAYKVGHRDARHAAAEMSLISDELLDALVSLQTAAYNIGGEHVTEYRELILAADDADNVIAKARGRA